MPREADADRFGLPVENWMPPAVPDRALRFDGRYVRVEPLAAGRHAAPLHAAFHGHPGVWDYMPYGPFGSPAAYAAWLRDMEQRADPLFFALYDKDRGAWGGVASYLRITPDAGSIEVGHIAYAPRFQRTRAATEAMVLLMGWAFEAGYRRYEWKCNALNEASRRAAQRLGFRFEGVFRQAAVVKGRNRDTAWFSIIDTEWPVLCGAFTRWLDPSNFSPEGRQVLSLAAVTKTN